jgi:superfamily II DNA or RNA helicase
MTGSALDAVLEELHRLSDREKGRRFEEMCAWLLKSDPQFAIGRTYSWPEWRERCLTHDRDDVGADTGIDIVAETDSGELWAVQTKCYRESTRVSTDDIDSFIARSATGQFAHRLLIATTNWIAPVGRKKLLAAQSPPGSLMRLDDLRDLERTDWPAVGEAVRPAVRRPQKLRPHQLAAVADVVRGFIDSAADRGQLLMACGTGKTLVGQRVAERLRSERTLVVVPSLSLVEQVHRSWKANATRRFEAFCFCSDPSVARVSDIESDHDVVTISVPVHTDPEQLAEFFSAGRRRMVVFATYQSLERLTEVFSRPRPAAPFDFAIADEAHRSAGRASSPFGLVCDVGRLPAARRLFMTATARVVTGGGDEDMVLSMDDERRYGQVFHRLQFSDAVEQGLLCDYQVLVIAAEPGEHLELVKSRRFVTTSEHDAATADALVVQLAIARAMARDDLRRVLTFHSRVTGAKLFAREFPATVRWRGAPDGQLWTQAVSGVMPAAHRRMFLRRLERLDGCDRGILSNARCFGEGVDVPAIDAVVFVDPRESLIDIVQAVGRTMRRSPETDKERGTIVLPVILDAEADADAVLSSSAFQTVWKVLRALRAHDDRLDDEMTALLYARARTRGAASGSLARVSFELPTITLDLAFADAFTIKAVEVSSDSFERGLAEFTAYVEEHGDGTVPQRYRTPTGFRLGHWISNRRQQFKASRLSAERVAKLDALGFVWDPLQLDFERGLAEFAAYVEANRSARVPTNYKTPAGFKLGTWCSERRKQRTAGTLPEDRVAALDELGFVWDPLQFDFELGLAELTAYVAQHSEAAVPISYTTPAGFKLGTWCGMRRREQKAGQLSAERITALDALGFVWDPAQQDFERGLAELAAYRRERSDTRVPGGHTSPSGFELDKWCNNRRTDRRAGKLSADRITALDELGFVWEPVQEQFERGLAELRAYVASHDGAGVPQRYRTPSGFRLGAWCGSRRIDRKAGRLSAERIAALDDLGFIWDTQEEGFEQGLAELRAYVDAHSDARVPQLYLAPIGLRLGLWCYHRRRDRKAGRLSPERIAALDALGFVWDAVQNRFDTGLAELTAYVDTHDDARVPQGFVTATGFKLGAWCSERRTERRLRRLSADRVRELDALGFIWNLFEDSFNQGVAELTKYVAEHCDARVPQTYKTTTGFNLGTWCSERRKQRKRGQLAAERVAALDALGFVWDTRRTH